MGRNKGFTLTEVIVSIVIVGIVGICVINIFAEKIRIDAKTTLNINVSNKITEIFNNFSEDPSTFPNKYAEYYVTETGRYQIMIGNNNNSYYDLTYSLSENYYTLTIKIFLNNEPFEILGTNTFTRRIYDGE